MKALEAMQGGGGGGEVRRKPSIIRKEKGFGIWHC